MRIGMELCPKCPFKSKYRHIFTFFDKYQKVAVVSVDSLLFRIKADKLLDGPPVIVHEHEITEVLVLVG